MRLIQMSIKKEIDQQYSQKINGLKEEIERVKKQRDLEIEKLKKTKVKSPVDELSRLQSKYVNEISSLQTQLLEFKKKESELAELIKLSKTQRSKINSLNESIRQIKSEEVQLKRKI